jgi:repressor LexA
VEPLDELTRRQRDILHAIRRLTLETGHCPSIREVMEAVGMRSPGSLYYQYGELMTKGHLRRVRGQPRTVEVRLPGEADFPARASVPDQLPGDGTPEADQGSGRASGGSGAADGAGRADGAGGVAAQLNVVMVPIAGRIAAGGPIRAEQEIEGYLPLPREVVGRADKLFMLRVSGDSMIGVGIFPGDLVVIQPLYEAPKNGDIVAATIDHVEVEGTVKTYLKEGRHVWLMPQNPAYTPIPGGKAKFAGKVVAVLRQV